MKRAATAKHLPNLFHRQATTCAIPTCICLLTASPVRRRQRTTPQPSTAAAITTMTIPTTAKCPMTMMTRVLRRRHLRSPVKFTDRWWTFAMQWPMGPDRGCWAQKISNASPPSRWAATSQTFATSKTLNSKWTMSKLTPCWIQRSRNQVSPSRRMFNQLCNNSFVKAASTSHTFTFF